MIKKNKSEESEIQQEEMKEVLPEPTKEELEIKRNAIINELKPKLLSKREMMLGGASVRSKASQESNYMAIIQEINEIGKKLGYADIGLGHLRRD